MTSSASSNAANPPNASQQSAPASYASAASANKKPSGNPLIASGSHQQLVTNAQHQHGKGPINGRPPITPALPTVAPTPALAHGSSNANINGGANSHIRTSSVTIKAPGGPAAFSQNTGNMAAKPNNLPQFGFTDEPNQANTTPSMSAAPIAIPSTGNPNRIPSPANSPRPIPISSGGPNNPSGLQANVQKPVFGSHREDSERHMRQNLAQSPMNNQHPHGRKDSHHSIHDPTMQPQNRGGFQGGRGGHRPFSYQGPPQPPYMNNYSNNRGTPQNRPISSPYAHHAAPNFAQSPRPVSRSIAPGTIPGSSPALANASPSMSQAIPYPQPPFHQGPANFGHGMPPNQYAGANHYMNAPGYNAPNPYGYNMGPQPPIPGYQGQPQASVFHSPQQQFNPTTSTFQPAGSQSMSRQGSAISHTERPGSSGPPPPAPPGNGPVIASGSHPGSVVQSKAAIVSGTTTGSSAFSRPKKSTIVIKTAQGEEVDFKKGFGAGSPVPLTASKTPPAKTPSPAPGVKPAEPPAEPTATIVKTTEERKKEFAEAVAKAKAETEAKAKEEAEAQAAAETKAKAEEQARIEAEAKAKKEAEAKAKKEAEARAKAEEEVKAKVEAEKKTQQEADMAAKAIEAQSSANPPSKLTLEELEAKGMDNMTPEEQELYFDLLDAQDAAREAEQEEITNRKKAEEAEAKVKADAERVRNAADEDRKLREAEAEAERLELEKEQRQKEREARGESMDIKTALTATIADLRAVPDKKESFTEPANSVGSVTNKMAGLSLNKNAALGAKSGSQRQKPAALNLQPLKTSAVEAPQPSAALQSLKSARFLAVMTQDIYPEGIKSPNPAVNAAARGKTAPFRYDLNFMLQFQGACKEAPSMDFQQQVKTLIGEEPGSRSASTKNAPGMSRQPSRAGGSSYTAMGSFGASGPMDRAMPGMGSGASRFGLQGNPPMGGRPQPNPMGSFPRGSFPGGTGMSRNSSNTGMIPNSPRTGSHRGGGSKRNNPHATVKQREKENVAMPLTQGMDIGKLTTSSSGWKPQSLSKKGVSGESGLMDPETVQRKVKAALNKMTPEKFDRLSDQILEIASQSKHEKDGRTLRQVIQLVFEKATDEAHWSGMYAKFCRRMLDTMDPEIRDEGILDKNSKVVFGGALFRKYLLNRCQEDFERGWAVNLPPPKEGESKEAVLLSDEYYAVAAVKRRGLGLVQFIGELFKLNMLTERIMHACIRKLLDYEGDPDEAEIESLCKLLKTVGQPLDESEKSHAVMNAYFQRINSMIETENLPSRMKFMLMDVVDLRKAGWESSADNKGPKTLEEVRADQERARAQKEAEAVRSQRQSGRAPGGRDNRNFSQGFGQSAPNQIGLDDLRRLKGSANRSSSHNITLGPGSSMLGSRSNSGRKVGGPGGSLGRSNDDGSRTGTPIQRQSTSNQFALLAAHEDTASPPSTAASPNLPKAIPASSDAKKAD